MSVVFKPAYRNYVLAVMTIVYALSFIDRAVMVLLLQSIKQDLQLSDTQLGFVTGIAFALFYATLGLPIARWADRSNRATISAVAIGVWGVTVMCGVLITNYIQLVFARIAAAVGEAGCKPPTYSLLGDYFPGSAERVRAMTIYLTGSPIASLAGMLSAGWLNEHYGWRMAFLLMGIPGLFFAVLIRLTVVDPRTSPASTHAETPPSPNVRDVFFTLWRSPSFRYLAIAIVLVYAAGQGMGPWYAAFMIRSHGMSTSELSVWLGLIFGVGGIASTLLGGYIANRFFASDERGQLRMSAVTFASVVPFYFVFLTVPGKHLALVALMPVIAVFFVFIGPSYALMQRLVPDGMRATTLALVMLLANLLGTGFGPQVVGILSDLLRPTFGQDSLRYAMLTMSFAALLAGYFFWKAGRTVREDLKLVGPVLAADPGLASERARG